MMKKILLALICAYTLTACTKNNDENNGNTQSGANSFKVTKGGGAGSINVTASNVVCGTETTSQGSSYSLRAFFSVGNNSTYDRLAIGFKTEPAAGQFTIAVPQYYANLPDGKAGVNITYDSYNYLVTSGSVTVSVTNGKKKIDFTNLVLESGAAVPGTTGTKLPDGSTITGSMTCN